ncbi:MAG TPA: hypothetical protein VK447_21965 [Myxococcaceae bacterium]|nr:hypothetical protein [Myxococcaceae bacterium]
MADLVLKGRLNLKGFLTLKGASGGKVKVGAAEALVEVLPAAAPQSSGAPPVLLPPPPAAPTQPQPTVWIVNSFNKTVKAGMQNIVTQGMAMQGLTGAPMWPGMVLPSSNNPTVTINNLPINVVNDMATIFPSGGVATFTSSGQM